MTKIADSSLSPSEKEEKEVGRLIDKTPAPSRKYTDRRGPKRDNRRQRMTVPDDDLKAPVEGDRDLSLNRAVNGSFRHMALILASKGLGKRYKRLKDQIKKFDLSLRDVSTPLANDFKKYAQDHYLEPADEGWSDESSLSDDAAEVAKLADDFRSLKKDVSQSLRRADRDTIVSTVLHFWPSGKRGWPARAAVLSSLEVAMGDIPIPEALKAPFYRADIADALQDNKIIRKLIESTNEKLSLSEIEDKVILGFAQLSAAYRTLMGNPDKVSADDISKGIDELGSTIQSQAVELVELGHVMESWHEAVSGFKPLSSSPAVNSPSDLDRVMKDLDSFFDKSETLDPGPVVRELGDYVQDNYSDVPEELQDVFKQYDIYFQEEVAEEERLEKEEKEAKDEEAKFKVGPFPHRASGAASNGTSYIGKMSRRLATFHGVDDRRGHPTNPPNTGYNSYDKRHFKEPHFKSILKAAGAILDDDWCKFGWENGADDAPIRAALDIAISVADDSLYQSKIDVETYDMLLNRLAKWGHDTFSETVLPEKDKSEKKQRSASAMNNESYTNIVRVANDLRRDNPKAALNILKNLRALVSTDADPAVAMQDMTSGPAPAVGMDEAPDAGMDDGEQVAVDPGDDISFQSMGEDDFKKLKDEMKRDVDKLFSEDDLDSFMQGFDDIMTDFQEKTASVIGGGIPLPVLIKVAASSEEAKRVLGPIIVAAKKKQDKKKKSKAKPKSKKDEKKDEKKNPFADKKAPPFQKGKKGKKRKAVAISEEDRNW